MVFSSVPVYLDPPNWQQPLQQQPNHQVQPGVGNDNSHHLPPLAPAAAPPPPPAPHHAGGGGGGVGSIRPGSMADRARLAKIPLPEPALKCPRCESTNTKFCYFNNYSLTQPRHFCKTCRRYWTRGGALRNVPVGGGCRRNKKSKSQNRSKSPASSSERQTGTNSSSTSAVPSEIMGHLPHQSTQLPFMTSLHNLTQFGAGNIGLNLGAIQGHMGGAGGPSGHTDMGFQMGSNSSMTSAILSAAGGVVQQFPLFDQPPSTGLFPFQSEGIEAPAASMVGDSLQLRSMTSSSRVSQSAAVKMEENQGSNLLRPLLGISDHTHQYWVGNTWTDLSGLNSSSTSHLL